jgi:hypothetical protein
MFLDHVAKAKDAWVARRAEIAAHWKIASPFDADTALEEVL